MTSLFERPFLITKMNLTSVSYKAFLIKGNACITIFGANSIEGIESKN